MRVIPRAFSSLIASVLAIMQPRRSKFMACAGKSAAPNVRGHPADRFEGPVERCAGQPVLVIFSIPSSRLAKFASMKRVMVVKLSSGAGTADRRPSQRAVGDSATTGAIKATRPGGMVR
jgi:hypothetical protein